jgi:hypothetical protein
VSPARLSSLPLTLQRCCAGGAAALLLHRSDSGWQWLTACDPVSQIISDCGEHVIRRDLVLHRLT